MKKLLVLSIGTAWILVGILGRGGVAPAAAQSQLAPWATQAANILTAAPQEQPCGKKVRPMTFYETLSIYSLLGGFGLLILGILVDRKALKTALFLLALPPFGTWVYVDYFVDFDEIRKLTFTYNSRAEGTLANIAEAQDRYKSEHDTYLTDLAKLYSHTAGSHGLDECVRIVKIEADWNHWYAVAQHVSSPETVSWDSRKGSSLKKG